LAVPVSGAYQLALGSNYNGACKPAIVWIAASRAHLIQQRQRPEDLLARDLPLPAT
jgi:diaminopimelate decarboxylase